MRRPRRRQVKGVERPLHSVFDHTADPATVDVLRLAIVEQVYRFRQSHLAFGNITADQLGTGEFRRTSSEGLSAISLNTVQSDDLAPKWPESPDGFADATALRGGDARATGDGESGA